MVMISGGIEVRSETQRVGLKEPFSWGSKAAYGGMFGRATMWAHTGTDKCIHGGDRVGTQLGQPRWCSKPVTKLAWEPMSRRRTVSAPVVL